MSSFPIRQLLALPVNITQAAPQFTTSIGLLAIGVISSAVTMASAIATLISKVIRIAVLVSIRTLQFPIIRQLNLAIDMRLLTILY